MNRIREYTSFSDITATKLNMVLKDEKEDLQVKLRDSLTLYKTDETKEPLLSPNKTEQPPYEEKGVLSEGMLLYSSEEDVDWKINLINFSQKQSRRESLHSELVEATGCRCTTHSCLDVIDKLRKENELIKKISDDLENTNRQITTELNDLRSQLSFKVDREKLLIEVKTELEAKLSQSKAQMQEFKVKLQMAQEVEEKFRQMEEKIRELGAENSCKFIEIIDLKETIESLEQELQGRASVERQLEKEIEEKKNLNKQLQILEGVIKCMKGIEAEESLLKQTLETKAYSPEYETFLETMMNSMTDSLSSLYKEKVRLLQRCQSFGLDIEVKNSNMEELRLLVDAQIKKNSKFARLQENKLKSKDEEIKTLNAEMDEAVSSNQKLQHEIETLKAQMLVKKEEMEELKSLVRILQDSEGAKIANVLREVDKERKDKDQEIKHYEEVVEKLNELNLQQQNNYDSLKENFEKLNTDRENLLEEVDCIKERLKYFKELYNKAIMDCEDILDEKNRIQRALSKTMVNSNSRSGQCEEKKMCKDLNLKAEKEALQEAFKEERTDWERIRKAIADKLSEDISDASSEVSCCDSRHSRVTGRESSAKIKRGNFEKLQIKIEKLQCKLEEQEKLLQDERQKNADLENEIESKETIRMDLVRLEVNNMEVKLRESNRNLSALLEIMKTQSLQFGKPKHLLRRSALSAVGPCAVNNPHLDSGEQGDSFRREIESPTCVLVVLKGLVDVTWILSNSLRLYGSEYTDDIPIPHVSSSEITVKSDQIRKVFLRPSILMSRPVSPDSPSLVPEDVSPNMICQQKKMDEQGYITRTSLEDFSSEFSTESSVCDNFNDNRQLITTREDVSIQNSLSSNTSVSEQLEATMMQNINRGPVITEKDLEKLYIEAISVLSHFCVSAEQYVAMAPEMPLNLRAMHNRAMLLREQLKEQGLCPFMGYINGPINNNLELMLSANANAARLTTFSISKQNSCLHSSLIGAPVSLAKWVFGKCFALLFALMAVIGFSTILLEVCYNISGVVRPNRYSWGYMTWEEILAPFLTRSRNNGFPPY